MGMKLKMEKEKLKEELKQESIPTLTQSIGQGIDYNIWQSIANSYEVQLPLLLISQSTPISSDDWSAITLPLIQIHRTETL